MDVQQIFNSVLAVLMSILSFVGKSFYSKLNTLEDKTFSYHADLSNYKTHVASTYMTAQAVNDSLREIKERQIRIENKIDALGNHRNNA
jgi:hypothetical protein